MKKTKLPACSPIISAFHEEAIHSIADLMCLSHNDIEQLQYTVFQSKHFLSYEEHEWIKSLISHIRQNEIFSNDELYNANIRTSISSSVNETKNPKIDTTVGGNTPSDTKGSQSLNMNENEVGDPASRKDPNTFLSSNNCGFNPSECKERELKVNRVYKPGNFICSPNSKFQFGSTARSQLCVCNGSEEKWCADSCCSSEIVYFQTQMNENGLVLSKGLKSKRIAKTGTNVIYGNGSLSAQKFHIYPTFKASDGGFVYVSNSEDRRNKMGGVGIIRFNRKGDIVDYKMILTETTANCGGVKTSWNTWFSCEENGSRGQVYETNPFGEKIAKSIRMGGSGRNYESVTCNTRNFSRPIFYLTHDSENESLCQYLSINEINEDTNKWSVPSSSGKFKFLVLDLPKKRFYWGLSKEKGELYTKDHSRNIEGIVFRNSNKLDGKDFQGKQFRAKKRKKTFKRKRKFKFRKKPLKTTKNNSNELLYDLDDYIMDSKNNSNELFYDSDNYIMGRDSYNAYTII